MKTTLIAQETIIRAIDRFECAEEIERFISGDLILVPTEIAPLPPKIFLTLNYDEFNLDTVLNSGSFDVINPEIVPANFIIEGEGVEELEFDLFCPKSILSTGEVLKEMKKDSDIDNPWLPGRVEHGLLFAETFPSVQKKNLVVAAGSVLRKGEERFIVYFSSKGTDRTVYLGSYAIEWPRKACFLRYRQRK